VGETIDGLVEGEGELVLDFADGDFVYIEFSAAFWT